MNAQIEDLAKTLEGFHISLQRLKKSVHWASDVVDNDGKSRLLKEIRGLKRIESYLCREYDKIRHSWDEIRYGFIPREYKNSHFTTSSAVFADIIVRLEDLTARRAACDDHISMRFLSLEWITTCPSLQT
jgi:hypothetical protein